MPTLKIKKLHPKAIVPTFAYAGDAGMDLYSIEKVVIKPGKIVAIPTGIACQLPRGTVGLFWDKSGLGCKSGLKILGGVIDSGYRGELIVTLANLSSKSVTIEAGHKVIQLLIQHVHHPHIVISDKLSDSHRGEKRYGSSGK